MKKQTIELVQTEIVSDLKKIKSIDAILLFGSYARGTQKPLSDIDICVIANKHISHNLKAKIQSYTSKNIDLSFFWDLPIGVKYAILREGKILFMRNSGNFHNTLVRTMHEYLDFKPVIDKNIARCFL
ncbi:nucleotidyltransferase domain-containing protein [Candidatus Woesearchaeota archaeon]|nr:nucleotidyltransferase domain-containing protein [Candidatus Woesearchaeota archaeon]